MKIDQDIDQDSRRIYIRNLSIVGGSYVVDCVVDDQRVIPVHLSTVVARDVVQRESGEPLEVILKGP